MSLTLLVQLAHAHTASDPAAAAVAAFTKAAESQDVPAMERVLHPSAVQHVRMGGAWSAVPTAAYLDLLRGGKIGGAPVQLEVFDVVRHDAVATVHARRTTPKLQFDDTWTVVEDASGWTIVGAAIVVTPMAAEPSQPR